MATKEKKKSKKKSKVHDEEVVTKKKKKKVKGESDLKSKKKKKKVTEESEPVVEKKSTAVKGAKKLLSTATTFYRKLGRTDKRMKMKVAFDENGTPVFFSGSTAFKNISAVCRDQEPEFFAENKWALGNHVSTNTWFTEDGQSLQEFMVSASHQ